MTTKRKMTIKQQRFADYYIETGNATQAAIRAGYSKKYANTNVSKLLQNTTVSEYIDKRLEELQSERVADQQEIMEFLTSVIRGKAQGTTLVGEGMGEQSVRLVTPTVAEKTSAAISLGKRYAMWTEKQQVENITPVFVEDVPEDDD
ncbi:terminase small subunit [Oceanobacillus oncorhynchi]|uniref:terminase small subunit n=1 Tax=Oceanobacillus oncorhynchi TaxID=545501 RepID=UPI0025A3817F|nr:terminase small subunit [Oceanobacillus oncorhynchi]MDM8100948.1 terminase small subunit [Oceanobacillus oncorhynchi]